MLFVFLLAQASPHAYFNALIAHPNAVYSRSLRVASQLSGAWTYDAVMDAAKGVVPVGDGVSDGNVGGHGNGGQMRLQPPVFNAGDDVLYTVDGWWGPEWGIKSNLGGLNRHKAYQITQSNDLWIEPGLHYDGPGSIAGAGDVANVGVRPYGQGVNQPPLGSGYSVSNSIIVPQLATFIIKPSTWTRFWWHVEKAAVGQWAYLSFWMADETRDPVQIYHRVPIQVVVSAITDFFWFEFNSSQKRNVGSPPLTIFQRNFVVLKGVGDPTPLLARPGVTPPPPVISPPTNVTLRMY